MTPLNTFHSTSVSSASGSRMVLAFCAVLLLLLQGCSSGNSDNDAGNTDTGDQNSSDQNASNQNSSDQNSSNQNNNGTQQEQPLIGEAPGAVMGLEGIAYTDTEVELFWERATDADGTVVGYSVSRDGVELQASLDGLSFYDSTITPGMSYQYTVAAIDNDGNTGKGVNLTLTTPDEYRAINADNYQAIVRQVLQVFASHPMRNSVYQPFDAITDAALEPDSSNFNPDTSVLASQYTCNNGGTASVDELQASATGVYHVTFDNCQLNDSVYQGVANFSRSEGQSTTREFVSYSVTDATGKTVTIDGTVNQSNYSCRSDNFQSWSVTDLSWESTSFEGVTRITDASTFFGAGTSCLEPWSAQLRGSFTLQSPTTLDASGSSTGTGNKSIAVSVTEAFNSSLENNTDFQTGMMTLTGADGSTLVFNADNGDVSSVAITIGGDANELTALWSVWGGILVPNGTGL